MKCDRDGSRQPDLCLAHVGQRLFEMLRRSCGMARGQLAGISKHKSDTSAFYTFDRRRRANPAKEAAKPNAPLYSPTMSCLECLR